MLHSLTPLLPLLYICFVKLLYNKFIITTFTKSDISKLAVPKKFLEKKLTSLSSKSLALKTAHLAICYKIKKIIIFVPNYPLPL